MLGPSGSVRTFPLARSTNQSSVEPGHIFPMEREWFTRHVTCPKCKKSGFLDLSEEVGSWAVAHPTLKAEKVPDGFSLGDGQPVPILRCSTCGVVVPYTA